MFEIKNKQMIASDIKRLDIYAPHIAKKVKPGQFISLCPQEGDERIPFSVVDSDPLKGTITLIIQEVGETTRRLGEIPINESIFSILGPLGVPAHIEKKPTIVCVTTGIGTAQLLPICRAYRKIGSKVIVIMGAKTKRALVLESQMRLACSKIFITTNDGSFERRGLPTEVLKEILVKESVDMVYATGNVDMMQAVCDLTKPKNIATRVQLAPMMVDCMGMCGSCRVKIADDIVLACVDGPEFDGHKVDFHYLTIRTNAFKDMEKWHTQSQLKPKSGESKTLMKFLSGILKK